MDKSNWAISINSYPNSKKKKVPVIAKVRERIIRSEHISHFHVISFEEDQLNSSDETLKIFVFF